MTSGTKQCKIVYYVSPYTGGDILILPFPSVCLSVCPSVCPSHFCFRTISREIIELGSSNSVCWFLTTRHRSSSHMGDLDLLSRSLEVIDLLLVSGRYLEMFTYILYIGYFIIIHVVYNILLINIKLNLISETEISFFQKTLNQ